MIMMHCHLDFKVELHHWEMRKEPEPGKECPYLGLGEWGMISLWFTSEVARALVSLSVV